MERTARALADARQKVDDDDDDDEKNTMCVCNLSCKCMPLQYWHCINELLEC